MAKRLFLLAAGALALTACTSEDVVKDVAASRNLIKFENAVNNHSRADITADNLVEFNVFGFYTMPGNDQLAHQVFYNTPVTRTLSESGATPWDYSASYGERYWVPDAKYYFYAYSCDNKAIDQTKFTDIDYSLDMSGEKAASQRVLEIQNYVCNDDHQHDLIFATNNAGITGKEEGNDAVALQFKHILSKVKARFTTKFPTEYEVVISDISIQDIQDQANYDPINSWHAFTTTADATALTIPAADNFKVTNTLVGEGEAKTQEAIETNQVYVIPKQTEEVALKFTVDVYVGADRSEKVMSKTLTGKFTPKWAEGYQYIYNVDINGTTTNMQVISFTTSVDPFKTPEVSYDIESFDVVDNHVKGN